MAGSVQLLNSIRDSIGGEYATRIPEATRANITEIGNVFLQYKQLQNSFFSELFNRIGRVTIEKLDTMEDPYSVFGSEELPFGQIVQEIFVDIVEGKNFVGAETEHPETMLQTNKGSIHVEYYAVDRRLFYKVTISYAELKEAFLSEAKLDEFIQAHIDSLARSYDVDRYIMLTNTFKKMCSYVLHGYFHEDTGVKDIPVNALVLPESMVKFNLTTGKYEWQTTGAKDFLKELRIVSGGLKKYHKLGYYTIKESDEDEAPASNKTDTIVKASIGKIKAQRTPLSKQILGLDVSTLAEIDVDALAVLFNLNKADIMTQVCELEDNALGAPCSEDESQENTAIHLVGFLCDKTAVKRGKSFEASDDFKNPESLYINFWQHHWGYMAISKFKDFVPIICTAYTPVTQTEGD